MGKISIGEDGNERPSRQREEHEQRPRGRKTAGMFRGRVSRVMLQRVFLGGQ